MKTSAPTVTARVYGFDLNADRWVKLQTLPVTTLIGTGLTRYAVEQYLGSLTHTIPYSRLLVTAGETAKEYRIKTILEEA